MLELEKFANVQYINQPWRTMQKIIGVTELQRRFRAIYDEVAHKHIPYVLTRGSRAEAVMISYADFLRYQLLDEQNVLARFDRLINRMTAQNATFDEEEVATDIAAARNEVTGL